MRVESTGAVDAAPTYDILARDRAHVALGTLAVGTPIVRTNMDATAAGGTTRYLVMGTEANRVVASITPTDAGADISAARLGVDETVLGTVIDATGAGGVELVSGAFAPSWVAYTVPVPVTVTAVVVQPTATGMTTPAGPDQLTAVSNAPSTISLWWSEVPNATRYQVFRSFPGGDTDRLITTTGSDANGNVMHQTTDGPVDVRYTYSYKIAALVKPGTTEIQTGFSPVASAQSLPLVPVSGLTYTLTPSTKTLGRLDARITWNTAQGAIKYMVYDPTWAAAKEFWPSSPQPATMSYVQPGLPVGYTLTVCVAVVYPFDRGGSPVPCIDIKT